MPGPGGCAGPAGAGVQRLTRCGGWTWTARVTLPPGRHVYSYIVDGAEWVNDPLVPLAPANEFGVRNSVVLVAEARSS